MRIYCLNLAHRKDRKRHSLEQFTKLGIPHNRVVYPRLIKDKRGGVYGCFDSHMKVRKDFYENYPSQRYCLVFEDDFVAPTNGRNIIKHAIKYLNDFYEEVDILYLHGTCIHVTNHANNDRFTNGYGFNNTAYLITRRYLKSLITKHGRLPEANGKNLDFETMLNGVDTDNVLYSEHLFFTKTEGFTQLIDKSDNYLNVFDELFRRDMPQTQLNYRAFFSWMKNANVLDDAQIKFIACILRSIFTHKLIRHMSHP